MGVVQMTDDDDDVNDDAIDDDANDDKHNHDMMGGGEHYDAGDLIMMRRLQYDYTQIRLQIVQRHPFCHLGISVTSCTSKHHHANPVRPSCNILSQEQSEHYNLA